MTPCSTYPKYQNQGWYVVFASRVVFFRCDFVSTYQRRTSDVPEGISSLFACLPGLPSVATPGERSEAEAGRQGFPGLGSTDWLLASTYQGGTL